MDHASPPFQSVHRKIFLITRNHLKRSFMSQLFSTVKVGPYTLQHRIVMAPLSRLRSDEGGMPTSLTAEYYGQRASRGGLIVSEGVFMADGANGYLGVPGINVDAQIAGWKKITDAVHAKGGHIF